MLKNDPNYRRLNASNAGVMSNSSFWLAQDHLLVVEVFNYTENYRRFYFRDIQALIIQKTKTQWWGGIIWTIALALTLLLFARNEMEPNPSGVAVGVSAIAALFCGFLLLLTFLRGPTCVVFVRTAVQTQKLPNVRQRRKAEKLIATLSPLIGNAQSTPATSAPVAATDTPPASSTEPS